MADGHTTGVPPSPADPDDSGGQLRRDIADELADHLELASRSEMLKGKDEPSAQREAISRFGNPTAIASRLYFAAMKGKIMRQNIQTAAVVCMAVAVVVLGVMSWMALRAGQRAMVQAMTLNNEAMLNAINGMNRNSEASATPSVAPDPMAWTNVTIQLVDNEGNAFDTSGFSAAINGKIMASEPDSWVRHEANDSGTIELGFLKVGRYDLRVNTPDYGMYSQKQVVIRAGVGEQIVSIHCPTPDQLQPMPTFTIDWPNDLKDISLSVHCNVDPSEQLTTSHGWQVSNFDMLCVSSEPSQVIARFIELPEFFTTERVEEHHDAATPLAADDFRPITTWDSSRFLLLEQDLLFVPYSGTLYDIHAYTAYYFDPASNRHIELTSVGAIQRVKQTSATEYSLTLSPDSYRRIREAYQLLKDSKEIE